MSLIVFEIRGIPATRRERIVAAVEAGGKRVSGPFEAWVTSDGGGNVRVVITGSQGFDRRGRVRGRRPLKKSVIY